MRNKVNAEIKQAEESEELLYKNKFSESGDDRDWRERDWWSLNLLLVIVVIVISLFTLGSIYSTHASGAEKMSETNNWNQTKWG